MATEDENTNETQGDPSVDVAAAQEQAESSPVTDDHDEPAADEDRNP